MNKSNFPHSVLSGEHCLYLSWADCSNWQFSGTNSQIPHNSFRVSFTVLHTSLLSIEYDLVLWNGPRLGFSATVVEAYKFLLWCRKALCGLSSCRTNMLVSVSLVVRETRHLDPYPGQCSAGISAGWNHNLWIVTQITHNMVKNIHQLCSWQRCASRAYIWHNTSR